MTLSLDRRRALIALAREFGFTIFEDDPYVDIRFRGEPLPSMLSLDDPANPTVVAAGSFTKTVCPGVRVGYLVGPAATIAEIAKRAVNTYISPNMLVRGHRAPVLCLGRHRPVHRDGPHGAGRAGRAAGRGAAAGDPGLRSSSSPTAATSSGSTCPRTSTSSKLVPAAAARGVAVVKGSDFLLEGGHHSLRLAFSAVTDRPGRRGRPPPRGGDRRRPAADRHGAAALIRKPRQIVQTLHSAILGRVSDQTHVTNSDT